MPTPKPLRWPRAVQAPSLFGEITSGADAWGYYAGQVELTGAARRLHLYPRAVSAGVTGEIPFKADSQLPKGEESLSIFLASMAKEPPLLNEEALGQFLVGVVAGLERPGRIPPGPSAATATPRP